MPLRPMLNVKLADCTAVRVKCQSNWVCTVTVELVFIWSLLSLVFLVNIKIPFLFINSIKILLKSNLIHATYDMFIFCNSLGFNSQESSMKFILFYFQLLP